MNKDTDEEFLVTKLFVQWHTQIVLHRNLTILANTSQLQNISVNIFFAAHECGMAKHLSNLCVCVCVMYQVTSVCVCLVQALTSECFDIGTSFLVIWYIFRTFRSRTSIEFTGQH